MLVTRLLYDDGWESERACMYYAYSRVATTEENIFPTHATRAVLLHFYNSHFLQNEAAVENAVKLDGSEFKGRTLKVTHKRVNQPGFHFQQQQQEGGGYRGGGRGGRGRGGFRGRGGRGFRGRGGGFRGRGGGFRGGGRGGGGYHPYY